MEPPSVLELDSFEARSSTMMPLGGRIVAEAFTEPAERSTVTASCGTLDSFAIPFETAALHELSRLAFCDSIVKSMPCTVMLTFTTGPSNPLPALPALFAAFELGAQRAGAWDDCFTPSVENGFIVSWRSAMD
jgi:hypothetical protein